MKRLAFLLSCLVLLSSFSDKSGSTGDCASVRNGKFRMESRRLGTCIIERMGNTQIETLEKLGQKGVFEVAWIDDCTYTLRLRKTLRNEVEIPFSDSIEVKARIMSVTDSSYEVETTSNMTTYATRYELIRVKE